MFITLDKLRTKIEGFMKSKDRAAIIFPLTPTSHAEKVEDYIAAMNAALKDSSIRNIAVTGRYGAGKSSFLRTYFQRPVWRWFHRQPLWVSVADFDSIGCNMESPQVQLAILQQILFVEEDKLMPFSRFSRIPRPRFWTYAYLTVCMALLIGTASVVTNPSWFHQWLISFGCYGESIYCWLGRLSPILVAASLIIVCKYGYDGFRKGCMSISLKLGPVAAESSRLKDVPVLACHFEELVYFFRSTRRREVVFEDLDRVKDKGIFVSLRTLNQLLNEAVPRRSLFQRRPIRFIYAVRDDIFNSAEERVKYFDFILPMIPVLSSEMSANLMKQLLQKAKISSEEMDVSSGVISKLCSYISDRRLVHAICNEFLLSKKILMDEAEGKSPYRVEKILAMCAFKVYYPWAYAQLTDCTNPIVKLLDIKREFVQKRVAELKQKIAAIEHKKNIGTPELVAKRIKDLNELYFIEGFLPNVPNDCVVLTISNAPSRIYRTKEFLQVEFIEHAIGNTISFGMHSEYYSGQYQYPINCPWSSIEKMVGGESYEARRKRIEVVSKEEVEELNKDIEAIREDMYDIENITLKDMINHGLIGVERVDDCFRQGQGAEESQCMSTDFQVLHMLLAEGLISEDYSDYVTLYQRGGLELSDYRFVVSVRQRQQTDPTRKIADVCAVFDMLQDFCFLDRSSLNYDLLSWLLKTSYSEMPYPKKIAERIDRVKKVLKLIAGNGHSVSRGWLDASDCYKFLEYCKKNPEHELAMEALFRTLSECNHETLNTFPTSDRLADDEKEAFLLAFLKYDASCNWEIPLGREHWQLFARSMRSAAIISECGMARQYLVDQIKLHGLSFWYLPSDNMPYPEYAADMIQLGAFSPTLDNLRNLGLLIHKSPIFDTSRVLTCIHQWGDENLSNYVVQHLVEIEDEISEKAVYQEDDVKIQRGIILRWDISFEVRMKVALNEKSLLIPMRELPIEMIMPLIEARKIRPDENEFCEFVRSCAADVDLGEMAKKLDFSDEALKMISKEIDSRNQKEEAEENNA